MVTDLGKDESSAWTHERASDGTRGEPRASPSIAHTVEMTALIGIEFAMCAVQQMLPSE
jgi:hypothetical protein